MLSKKSLACVVLLALSYCVCARATYESDATPISASVHSAAFLGQHAGLLSGGKALNELEYGKAEEHDFSEAAAKNSPSNYESLGSLGDHLGAHDFPSDYGHEAAAGEYGEAAAEATEHQLDIVPHEGHYESGGHAEADFGAHLNEHDLSQLHGDLHGDFHSEPVVGIDHGKGAFSYSTLYEHKHGEEHELHQEAL